MALFEGDKRPLTEVLTVESPVARRLESFVAPPFTWEPRAFHLFLFGTILDKNRTEGHGSEMSLPQQLPSPAPLAVLPARKGRRQTEQRRAVFDALMAKADHPTAVEVFMRVKGRLPSISLATVYNCLDTLVECGVVRMVHRDREPSRFCANLKDHAHFFCTHCGSVTDLPLRKPFDAGSLWDLPEGVSVLQQDTTFRGLCGACSASKDGVVAPETGVMVGGDAEAGGSASQAV